MPIGWQGAGDAALNARVVEARDIARVHKSIVIHCCPRLARAEVRRERVADARTRGSPLDEPDGLLRLPAAAERSVNLHQGQELAELGLGDSELR